MWLRISGYTGRLVTVGPGQGGGNPMAKMGWDGRRDICIARPRRDSPGGGPPQPHLEMRVDAVGIPIVAGVHELLRIGVVYAAMVAVGFLVHEELHVGLLGLEPHGGVGARSRRRGSRRARPLLPVRRAPPRPAQPGRRPLPARGPGHPSPAPPRRAARGLAGHP